MKHRTFIAINLSESTQTILNSYRDKYLEIPAKWINKENLHITLLFVGEILAEELVEICDIAKSVAENNQPFYLNLNKICFGPKTSDEKKPPRMIWATGEVSEKLNKLKSEIEKIDNIDNKVIKEFTPHITLARVKAFQFNKIDPAEMQIVDEDISLRIPVTSIEVMESILKRKGPEYHTIESYELRG